MVIWAQPGLSETRDLLRRMAPVDTGIELVRIGGNGDGAYLVPNDLDGITALLSPGVSDVAQFEVELAERGIECFLADASVEGSPVDHPMIHFEKKFIGIDDRGDFMRLDTWVEARAPGASDLILQMDIEGAEWQALTTASPALLARLRIVVLELHDTERLLDCAFRRDVLDRLLATHMVVHLHVNNYAPSRHNRGLDFPPYLEATFLRRDRATPLGPSQTIPHPLDIVNVPENPIEPVPPCWLG